MDASPNDDKVCDEKTLPSFTWKYFSVKDTSTRVALCNLCEEPFTYRGAIANLTEHLLKSHSDEIKMTVSSDLDDGNEGLETTEIEDDGDNKNNSEKSSRPSLAWRYFEIQSKSKRIAICKFCHEPFSYQSTVYNLTKHILRKHADKMNVNIGSDIDDGDEEVQATEDDKDTEDEAVKGPERSHRSYIAWNYFKVQCKTKKIAVCNFCKESFSYRSTVYNLIKHILRKHPSEMKISITSDVDDEDEIMDDRETEKDRPKRYPRSSASWRYFKIQSKSKRIAICNLCHEPFSYWGSVSNLTKHLIRKHSKVLNKANSSSDDSDDDVDDENQEQVTYLEEDGNEDKRKVLRSDVWQYFQITDDEAKLAKCMLCQESFSFKTTSTNLSKHLKRLHGIEYEHQDYTEQDSIVRNPTPKKSSRHSKSWEYFEIQDPVKRIARCKLCFKECSYFSSVSNLMKHVRRSHTEPFKRSMSDDEAVPEMIEYDSDDKCDKDGDDKFETKNTRSAVWLYFERTDTQQRLARCLVCHKQLSYMTSVTNLKRHLDRKHPKLSFNKGFSSKQMIVSSNGQLYEIDENSKDPINGVDSDQNAEPMEIYLDEMEGNVIEQPKLFEPKKNKPQVKMKALTDTSDESDDSNVVNRYKKYSKRRKNDPLNRFGSYIVSLLKQLPEDVSNQLQAEFIKQIMACKNYGQKVVVDNSTYSIAITETQANEVETQYVEKEIESDCTTAPDSNTFVTVKTSLAEAGIS